MSQILNPKLAMIEQNMPGGIQASTNMATACTGSNVAGVINLSADTARPHNISKIWWSYSGAPTAGRIQLASGASVIIDLDITASGKDSLDFNPAMVLDKNTSANITLAAAGAVTGKVGVLAWRLD